MTDQRFIPDLLYEDNHLIAVCKPASMLTQADASAQTSLLEHLKDYIKKRDNKPGNVYLGMVQRLDKPVSGVIVFAKTSKAAKRLAKQIRERRLGKFYLAVTEMQQESPAGNADLGIWNTHRHSLHRVHDTSVASQQSAAGAQEAVLHLKTLFCAGDRGLHLIRLETGRKHQIRAQLAALGMAICGDRKYGASGGPDAHRIALHAHRLELLHPTRKTVLQIISPPPDELFEPFAVQYRTAARAALSQAVDPTTDRA
jgi:23S rRNA pseudouridine1911/1915/1917 synthase